MLSRLLSIVIVAFTYLTTYSFLSPCLLKAPAPVPKAPAPAWKCPDEIEPGEYTLTWGSGKGTMTLRKNGTYSWDEPKSVLWVGGWEMKGPKILHVEEWPHGPKKPDRPSPFDWTVTLDEAGDGVAHCINGMKIPVKIRPLSPAKK